MIAQELYVKALQARADAAERHVMLASRMAASESKRAASQTERAVSSLIHKILLYSALVLWLRSASHSHFLPCHHTNHHVPQEKMADLVQVWMARARAFEVEAGRAHLLLDKFGLVEI